MFRRIVRGKPTFLWTSAGQASTADRADTPPTRLRRDRRPGKGQPRFQTEIACERAHRSRSRIDHVRSLGGGRLSAYKGATDSENVRARQRGTHARPAAGGVSGQARPGRLGRQLTGARMVARLTYLPATAP